MTASSLIFPILFNNYFGILITDRLMESGRLMEFNYLTIIPRARMGSESIADEAEGWMGYWFRGHEGESNNCFSKIQLVGQKYWE